MFYVYQASGLESTVPYRFMIRPLGLIHNCGVSIELMYPFGLGAQPSTSLKQLLFVIVEIRSKRVFQRRLKESIESILGYRRLDEIQCIEFNRPLSARLEGFGSQPKYL